MMSAMSGTACPEERAENARGRRSRKHRKSNQTKVVTHEKKEKIVNPVVLAASTSCSDVQPDLKNIAECGN